MDTANGVGTRTLVVRGEEDSAALEEGSILCLTDRRVLGSVAEVFGPVSVPHYIVTMAKAGQTKVAAAAATTAAAATAGGEGEDEAAADGNAPAADDKGDEVVDDVVDALEPDTPVFAVKQKSKHITLAMLVSKGCDASNEHDEEVCWVVLHWVVLHWVVLCCVALLGWARLGWSALDWMAYAPHYPSPDHSYDHLLLVICYLLFFKPLP